LIKILKRIPTAQEIIIKGPGHFLQEEAGPEYAGLIIEDYETLDYQKEYLACRVKTGL